MGHPSRFIRRGAVAVIGAAAFAGIIFFGPTPLGRAIVASRDGSSLAEWEPDPDMPLPEIDEPAISDPALLGPVPLHPPGTHRHRHHSTVQPGR
jgi:hypothetical protein